MMQDNMPPAAAFLLSKFKVMQYAEKHVLPHHL